MVVGTIHLGKGYAKLEYDTSIDALTIYFYDPSVGNYVTKIRIKLSTGDILAIGKLLTDLVINKSIPRLYLAGSESGGKSISIREDSGKLVVRDETAGIDILTITNGVLETLFVKSASPTPGVGGAYGSAVDIVPDTGFKAVFIDSITLTWGGTFGTGETVTISITVTFSDDTTASITRSATAIGSITLNPADLQPLYKHGVYITKISVASSSNLSSTSVTTSVTIYGKQVV